MQPRAINPRRFRYGRFLLGLALSLVAMDCGLRLIESTALSQFLPVVQPILGRVDKEMGFDYTPGAEGVWASEHRARIRINALGLRDVERTLAKPPGTFRVGLAGDSMVEAMQVSQDDTFGTIAERRLRAERHDVELINLGMAGPNPIRHLVRLEKRGYPLNLDLVVAIGAAQSFLSGALLDDSANPAYVDAPDGGLVRGYGFRNRLSQRHADDLLGRSFFALAQNFPLVRMIYLQLNKPPREIFGLGNGLSLRPKAPPPEADACKTAAAALEPHARLWLEHRPGREWAAAMHFLDDFAASTAAHHVRTIYALRDIPLAPPGCPAVDLRRAQLIAGISPEFGRRGMRFVDWSAALVEVAGSRNLLPLYGFGPMKGDGHLNFAGHRMWAAALIRVLGSELPGPVPRE